jgi:hypothetical protein
VRFDYSHELHAGTRQFREHTVQRERRISIMFRNEVERQHQGVAKNVSYGTLE